MQILKKYWVGVAVILAIVVPLALWWAIIPWKYIKTPESFSALFTALAFAALLVSLRLQALELKLTRDELTKTAEANLKTAEASAESARLSAINLRIQYLSTALRTIEPLYQKATTKLNTAGLFVTSKWSNENSEKLTTCSDEPKGDYIMVRVKSKTKFDYKDMPYEMKVDFTVCAQYLDTIKEYKEITRNLPHLPDQ